MRLLYLKQYFAAIWADWLSRMSGIAGIILLVIGFIFGLTEIGQARYWVIAAIACYVIASFITWQKERQTIEGLERTVASLTQSIEGLNQAEGGTSLTIDELVGIYKSRTTMQGEKLVAAHIGKWMTVSGLVNDIDRWKEGISVTFLEGPAKPVVVMKFDETFVEPVSALVKGDNITVRGQIERIAAWSVRLEHCELVRF